MKKKMTIMLPALISVFCSIASCRKIADQQPAPDVYFQLRKAGNIYPDSMLSRVKCFYYNKDGDTIHGPGEAFGSIGSDDTVFCYWDSGGSVKGLLRYRYLTDICADQHINNFYLELPDGDIDTLWVDAAKTTKGAYTSVIRQLRFNGTPASLNDFYYLFDKN